MESGGFHYDGDGDQWREMVEIVKREGGQAAVDKLVAKRATFENRIKSWKRGFDKKRLARDKASNCKKIKAASANLRAVLSKLTTLMRDDPVWEPLAEKLTKIVLTLDHIDRVAEQRGRRRGRPENKDRDILFKLVGQFWDEDLGLPWTRSESPMTRFISAACRHACDATSSAISQALIGGRRGDLEWAARVTIGGVNIVGEDK
jgi:hypothetical protein